MPKDSSLMQDDTLSQANNSLLIDNAEEIGQKLFKYGQGAAPKLRQDPTNISLTNAAPAFVELIKLEKFSMMWGSLSKMAKPLDFLIGVLSEIRSIYKPVKTTLFVLDKHLQAKLFVGKDKLRHYKKIMIGAQVIYGIFSIDEEYSAPSFKTIEEAQMLSRTPYIINIPIKK